MTHESAASTTSPPADDQTGRTPVKAAVGSFMGSAVEYYDFFIFGSAAALIFPHIFFPNADAQAAIMSFMTFGFAYIARPIGAVILGHFGDRIGRQKVLMFTLLTMGAATFVIGCLPTFSQVGWLAPILLIVARLAQGLSAAGEQAGASSLSLEHAPDNRRSFFTSWTLTGTQGGQILAALAFIPVVALPDDIKYSIGWRIPFWLSAVVVIVAFFIRRSLHETPEFEKAKANNEIVKLPVGVLMKNHWRDVLRVICCAFISAVSTVYGTLAISYGKEVGAVDTTITLWLVVAGNVVALFTQPMFGNLADRIGRKPVFIWGALGSAAIMPFYLLSMETSNTLLQFALSICVFSFAYAAANATWPSFYAEMFSSKVRFSGLAIGTQLGFLMAGFAPAIVTAMGGLKENGWVPISIFTAVIAVISAASALTAKETYRVPTSRLGLKSAEVPSHA
ncbi:MFS transporter [Neomicrococcus aestuarii]|uniref:MFS transporter n=1 Tax=Neomicrococcus aestuarii TaxID=556325 RepID=A0A1L2ZPA6_9MICC|nr:MFS transporter [Neomicrococcus aestuarii]APF40959.1 MFS transporter [Neomicrococcus aestuarii]